jgi:hypothetical protein
MSLAIRTRIPFSTWLGEGDQAIATALRLIDESDREQDQERRRWEARQRS